MEKELSLIVFGWLLGLLGPAIVDAIKKRYQRKDIKAAIDSELSETQYRLAASVYVIRGRYGAVDKALIDWILSIFRRYSGAYATGQLLSALERQSELTEEQLTALGEYQKSDGTKALSLRVYTTPFIDAHIASLALFSPEFQVASLEMKTQLGLLNDQKDAKAYRAMTFQPDISEQNYASVRKDIENVYKHIAERSHVIAKAIDRIRSIKA